MIERLLNLLLLLDASIPASLLGKRKRSPDNQKTRDTGDDTSPSCAKRLSSTDKGMTPPAAKKPVKWKPTEGRWAETDRSRCKPRASTLTQEGLIQKSVDRKPKIVDIDLEERGGKWREERSNCRLNEKTEITVPKAIKRRIKVAETITVGDLAGKRVLR